MCHKDIANIHILFLNIQQNIKKMLYLSFVCSHVGTNEMRCCINFYIKSKKICI